MTKSVKSVWSSATARKSSAFSSARIRKDIRLLSSTATLGMAVAPAYVHIQVVHQETDRSQLLCVLIAYMVDRASASNSLKSGLQALHRHDYATVASPFFSTSDSSLSEAPEGRFSPRSHLLTRLLVTFR